MTNQTTTTETDNESNTERLSYPRTRRDDGTAIVRWSCDNCGHETDAAYNASRLEPCPSCGGNPQGVRPWSVESIVEDRQQRLRDQLAERYGPENYMTESPVCESCGATDDVHICPGEQLDDIQYRCDDCRRMPKFWWQPGDHRSLLVRDWIETCDKCDAEFTTIFGVTFWIQHGSSHTSEDFCLRCADPDRIKQFCEVY